MIHMVLCWYYLTKTSHSMHNDTYNIIRHGSIHVRQGLLLKLSVATYLATVI